jgi:hypothetical protein
MDHHMAIIESLDPDTETRRLSPVAIFGKKNFPCYLEVHLFLWKNQQFLHVRYLPFTNIGHQITSTHNRARSPVPSGT